MQSCGAPAAQPGWLACVKVTASFSIFKIALASLLLCSDGDGLPGAEVAHGEDSSFEISGTFLMTLQPSALPAGWAGTTCGEHTGAGCAWAFTFGSLLEFPSPYSLELGTVRKVPGASEESCSRKHERPAFVTRSSLSVE